MATFTRGHSAYLARLHNARLLATLGPDAPKPHTGSRFEFPAAADLRGLPAVGRGVSGAIRGTQPEAAACR